MRQLSASEFIELRGSDQLGSASGIASASLRLVGRDSAERVRKLTNVERGRVEVNSVVVSFTRQPASAWVALIGGFGPEATASVNLRLAGAPAPIAKLLQGVPEKMSGLASAAVHFATEQSSTVAARSQVLHLRGRVRDIVGTLDQAAVRVSARVRLRGPAPELEKQARATSSEAEASVSGRVKVGGARFSESKGLKANGASVVNSVRVFLKGRPAEVASAIVSLRPASGVVSFG
jgi:hypothetical protein